MAVTSLGLKTHIYNNNLKSTLLLAGFPILVFGIVFTFYALLYGFGIYLPGMMNLSAEPSVTILSAAWGNVLDASPFVFGGVLIWFCIAFFFHSRMIQAAAGSVPVDRKQFPKIYNMLENLCIARGLKMPQFYIIDSPALNAFASGISEKSFSITLTRGIIESLEPDELEAVIAHELSHIVNRDVRLLIISVIFVGIFSFLAEMLFRSMIHGRRGARYRYQGSSNNRQGGNGIVMLIALAVLAVGYLLAILIRFALSRKREYLADAGSVELTRNPESMMRALMRISGKDRVDDMPIDVQQMCIVNSHKFMSLFATHPPIDVRIQAISEMTGTPIPKLPISLRRRPLRPWDA